MFGSVFEREVVVTGEVSGRERDCYIDHRPCRLVSGIVQSPDLSM